MKRFLILFTLVAFLVTNCAGTNKVRWARPGNDLHQKEFEKDRAGCLQSIDQSLDSEAFGQALLHGFVYPFEVTSLLLIVAVLGAMVLGRKA